MKGTRIGIVALLSATALLWAGMAGAGATDAEKCESKKQKEVGKYASCLQKAESKALLKGVPPDFTKCNDKFFVKWGKIESKAGAGVCPSEGDQALLQTFIADCADCVALALDGEIASCTCHLDTCSFSGGVSGGPACWFLGAPGADCDATCAGVGLAYDDATRTYAGSDGPSFAECDAVLEALGVPAITFGDGSCSSGLGCFYQSNLDIGRVRCTTPTTTASGFDSSNGTAERACACQ